MRVEQSRQLIAVYHDISQDANSFHCDLNYISGLQRTHAGRSSRRNQVPRLQSHHLGDVPQDDVQRKEKVAGRAALPDLPVDARLRVFGETLENGYAILKKLSAISIQLSARSFKLTADG